MPASAAMGLMRTKTAEIELNLRHLLPVVGMCAMSDPVGVGIVMSYS